MAATIVSFFHREIVGRTSLRIVAHWEDECVSKRYAAYRQDYPPDLFDRVVGILDAAGQPRGSVLDFGCGSDQAGFAAASGKPQTSSVCTVSISMGDNGWQAWKSGF
jgi:hypothetical protein